MNPPFPWYGGKARKVRHLLPLLEVPHTTYVEPFGGAAALLFAKPPSPSEVFNDLNDHVVNFMRHLQDPVAFADLERRLYGTLEARAEYELAIEVLAEPETPPAARAWAFFVTTTQCFGARGAPTPGRWARDRHVFREMNARVSRWWGRVDGLAACHERLASVVIERQDALKVLEFWDAPDTLFYLDPPYVHETRPKGQDGYDVEMTTSGHQELVEGLLGLQGMAFLSGYDHAVYAPLVEAGWVLRTFEARSYMAHDPHVDEADRVRTEILWVNPQLEAALGSVAGPAVSMSRA